MKKRRLFILSAIGIVATSVAALSMHFSLKANGLNKINEVNAEEKVLVEDFADPQFASKTLHTVDGQTYVDLVCSDAAVNGASLVMQNGSTAEAAVKGVSKIKVTFTGDLSVSIATKADKYYVTEDLVSGTL